MDHLNRVDVNSKWEYGEVVDKSLSTIAACNPVTCAMYAIDIDLLDLSGWNHFRNLAKHQN